MDPLSFTCARCDRDCQRYGMGRETGSPICKSCYLSDLTTPEAVAKKQVIAGIIKQLEPRLSRSNILAAIDASASNLHGISVFARQLEVDPAVLLASSRATKSIYGLVVNLRAMGATNVALPRCSNCKREALLTARNGQERVCESCYHEATAEECSACGRRRRVMSRRGDGAALCSSCHQRDPTRWETCSLCGDSARINARASDGGAICPRCYDQPKARCGGCGELREITSRKDGRSVCSRCYRHPQRPCGNCGRTRRIYRRATAESPDLCHACWWEPIALCSRCGDEGMCNGLRIGKPLCLRCRLEDRVDEVLSYDGTIREELVAVRDAILAVDNPRSGHVWLSRSPAVALLKDLAADRLTLSHAALDELNPTPSLIHLRDLLIGCGALPERDPYIARLELAIKREAASLSDPHDAQLLRSFGTWRISRRARRRVELGRGGATVVKNAQSHVREAARFLRWLRQQGRGPAECVQADVDRWLEDGVLARFRIREFIVWASEIQAMPRLVVPVVGGNGSPSRPVDLEQRVVLSRRLLHDESLDPADRVAGMLVAVYAQPVTRVAHLTLDDVAVSDDEVTISLGNDALLVPEPLGRLVRELPWRRQVGIACKLPARAHWLFPGRQAGRPQHPEYMRTRLAKIGINCRQIRNAALFELARDVPAAVLADMLGLHPTTAVRWVERAGRNWSNYAAVRTRSVTND